MISALRILLVNTLLLQIDLRCGAGFLRLKGVFKGHAVAKCSGSPISPHPHWPVGLRLNLLKYDGSEQSFLLLPVWFLAEVYGFCHCLLDRHPIRFAT
ncbi:hypothetical protein AVEN_6084-1 [Araneus ventricosus]|uniref:Secreted protein n=1 Tax=Araneus ventricosus TaxID=182803 RepID=A0A4Y2GV42_ARAVE|nr:hypothetical protein AVEN_6084-1 [Araneus ventricosus]